MKSIGYELPDNHCWAFADIKANNLLQTVVKALMEQKGYSFVFKITFHNYFSIMWVIIIYKFFFFSLKYLRLNHKLEERLSYQGRGHCVFQESAQVQWEVSACEDGRLSMVRTA